MKSLQQLKPAQRQRGMSTLTLLVVIALVGLGITCGLKMIPAYINYWSLKGIFESVEAEPGIAQSSPKDIESALQKRLDINSARDFDPKKSARKTTSYLSSFTTKCAKHCLPIST